jgi:hypothetical protein
VGYDSDASFDGGDGGYDGGDVTPPDPMSYTAPDSAASSSASSDDAVAGAAPDGGLLGGLKEMGQGAVDWATGHYEMAKSWENGLYDRASAAYHGAMADPAGLEADFDQMRQDGELWDDGARRADKGLAEIRHGAGF